MKFLRYGPEGHEKPGVLDKNGKIRDLSGKLGDLAGESVFVERLTELAGIDPASLPEVEGTPRIGPCLAWVPNFYCIELN